MVTVIMVGVLLLTNLSPRSPIRMWPVLRFAVSRTASVMNRTSILISSIRHKNGLRAVGDPIGSRWDKKLLGLNSILADTIANHSGSEIVRLIAKCLVSLNTFGTIPSRFSVSNLIIIAYMIVDDPPSCLPSLRFTSSSTVFIVSACDEFVLSDEVDKVHFILTKVIITLIHIK